MKGRKFQQIKLGYYQQIEESSGQASQTIGADIPNGAAQAELLRAEQLSLQHNAELAFHAQAKAQQIDTLQASLQTAIQSQATKLAAIEQERPAWPTSKQARTLWQNQIAQAKAHLAQLERRSERVKEIAQDAGLYADSMLDELAARKLRFHRPDLARQWDALQQQQRPAGSEGRDSATMYRRNANRQRCKRSTSLPAAGMARLRRRENYPRKPN